MTPIETFFWGFFGSAAAEVVALYRTFSSGGKLPGRYKQPVFFIVCLLLSIFAGIFAVAISPQNTLSAFGVGVATPVLIERLKKGKGNV